LYFTVWWQQLKQKREVDKSIGWGESSLTARPLDKGNNKTVVVVH
jgi:hypothetical protein